MGGAYIKISICPTRMVATKYHSIDIFIASQPYPLAAPKFASSARIEASSRID